jgi:hypothetical protein
MNTMGTDDRLARDGCAVRSIAFVFAMLALPTAAWAQDEGQGTPPPEEGAPEQPAPGDSSAAQDESDAARAQAQTKVDEAKKLAKIQRYAEAIAHVEEAYLVLEDPELLRILGEYHAAAGDFDKALRSFDSYLEDSEVGEMAKGPVRARRAQVEAALSPGNNGQADKEREAKDDDDETLGGEWQFSSRGGGTAGRFYLSLGGRISHLEGPSYAATRGGSGSDANTPVSGSWVHGGVGLVAEFGGYLLDELSLGVEVGNQWMNWEIRSADTAFKTTLIGGHRPEVALVLRSFVGIGFYAGIAVGGDMLVFSEPITRSTCHSEGDCAPVEIDKGVAGYRGFGGLNLGYRTDLVDEVLIGVDLNWRYVPIFSVANDALDELPSYTDPSWMLELGFAVTYNP